MTMIRPGTEEQRAKLVEGDDALALEVIPELWAQPPKETLGTLPKPTRKNAEKGNCTECGKYHGLPAVHLDYMGHADVTLALIDIDPQYEYGWLENADGTMLIRQPTNGRLVLEGWLTVHGTTHKGVGTCESSKMEPEKELIGDLLRNCSMRFGVATALWSKSDAHEGDDGDRQTKYSSGPQPWDGAKSEPEGPDPVVVERINAVMSQLTELAGNSAPAGLRDRFTEWKGPRKAAVPAFLDDLEWLQLVEDWLDENVGVPDTITPEPAESPSGKPEIVDIADQAPSDRIDPVAAESAVEGSPYEDETLDRTAEEAAAELAEFAPDGIDGAEHVGAPAKKGGKK